MSRLETEPRRHTPVALLLRQLEGIDGWNRARQSRECAQPSGPASRQDRLLAARRIDVLVHAHATVLARASAALAEQPKPLAGLSAHRAVVAHRHQWFADELSQALEAHGVDVISVSDNAAEALGVVVAEQPELLVVGDPLVMLTTVELLSEAARFAPQTLRAVQVSNGTGVGLMLEAGAHSVVTQHVPPQETADQLRALLELGPDRPAGARIERAHMMRARQGGETRDV
jgi:hypothetical protein